MSRGRARDETVRRGSIDLHIGDVVLNGFERTDGYAIAEALRAHIAGLLESRGLPPSLTEPSERERLDVNAAPGPNMRRPEALGANIARTVYEGLVAWRP